MIDKIEITSDAAMGFGKDYVGGISVTMQDHVTCVVSDKGAG